MTEKIKTHLLEHEDLYRYVVEKANDMIIISQDMKIKYSNPRSFEIIGYKPEELYGTDFTDYIHHDNIIRVVEDYESIIKKEEDVSSVNYGIALIHRDGRRVDVELSYNLISYEGRAAVLAIVRDVTKQNRTNDELRKTQQKMNSIVKSTPDIVYQLDRECKITYINDAVKQYGYTPEELVGKNIMELVHPEDRDLAKFRINERRTGNRSTKALELRLFTKGRAIVNFESLSDNIIPDKIFLLNAEGLYSSEKPGMGTFLGTQGIARDITERKRVEDELRESEEWHRMLFNSGGDAIFVTENGDDFPGRIIDVNDEMCRKTGYTRNELLEMTPFDLVDPESLGNIAESKNQMKKNGSITFELVGINKDGSRRNIEINAKEFIINGRPALLSISRDITERKYVEKALIDSEVRYRELFNNMSNGVAVYEAVDNGNDFVIKDFNRAGEKIEHLRKEDIIGKCVTEAFPGVKESGLFKVFQQVLRTGEPHYFSNAMYKDEHTQGWRENWVYRLPGGEIVAVYNDITERKLAKKTLEERVHFATLLSELSAEFVNISASEIDDKIECWLRRISDFLEVDRSTFFQYVNGTIALTHSFSRDGFKPRADLDLNNAKWIVNKVISGEIISFSSIDELPEEAEIEKNYFKEIGLKSSIVIPLFARGTFRGSLTFSLISKPREWTDELVQQLKLVGDVFANALDRKQAEEALRESEEKYRDLIENINEVIYSVNKDGIIEYISPAVETIFDYKPSEVIGRNFIEFIHEDDRNLIIERTAKKFKNIFDKDNLDFRMNTKRGEFRWCSISSRPEYDGDNIIRLRGVLSDITEKKKIEENLLESEERFRTIFQESADAIMILDEKGFIDCNNATLEMFGYTDKDEFIGLHLSEISPPYQEDGHESRIAANRRIEEAYMTGSNKFEWLHRRVSGDDFNAGVLLTAFPFRGKMLLQSVVRDITDRKRAETELRDSEERLTSFMQSATDSFCLLDSNLNIIEINRRGQEIIGKNRDEIIGINLDDIVPDLKESGHYDRYNELLKTGMPFTIENFSLKSVYGDIQVNLKVFKVGDGIGIITSEITDLVKAKERIEASLKEKEILLKEIHHRVKNNMQVISSLLALQADYIDDEKHFVLFRNTEKRVRSMALVHEMLYRTEDFSRIDFSYYISELTDQLFSSYNVNPEKIKQRINVGDIHLGIDDAIPCALIINELISNSLKHAFPGDMKGEILIDFHKDKDSNNKLVVCDNGIGIPLDFDTDKTDSLGFTLIYALTGQLKGKSEIEREKGTKFTITF